MPWVLITSTKEASNTKKFLEQRGLYDKNRKVAKLGNGEVSIPIKTEQLELEAEVGEHISKYPLSRVEFTESEHGLEKWKMQPHEKLKANVAGLFTKYGIPLEASLLTQLPKTWERHGDLVLLSRRSFQAKVWEQFGVELWSAVAASLGAKRIAKKSAIFNDDFRTPNVQLLLGENGIVHHIDNGVKYYYDITKCMFSSGNVTEKIRISKLNCNGETVVDLYAGIGYFVLPYLTHSKAHRVHACEWNKHAVEALRENLRINGVADRCVIHEGDNRKFPYRGIADRVNLGLIPSSEASWPVACAVLRPDKGGWLHVHGNVSSGLNSVTGVKNEKVFCGSEAAGELCGWDRESCQETVQNAKQTKIPEPEADTNKEKNTPEAMKEIAICGTGMHCCHERSYEEPAHQSEQQKILQQEGYYANTKKGDVTKAVTGKFVCGAEIAVQMHGYNSESYTKMPEEEVDYEIAKQTGSTLEAAIDTQDVVYVKERGIEIPSCNKSIRREWVEWADHVVSSLKQLLSEAHCASGVDKWRVSVSHLEHVKSYAPHISHLVLDVECRPQT